MTAQSENLVIGIDATNLRRGGGRTHLIELLRAAVVLAVAHNQFKKMGFENLAINCKPSSVIYDLKNVFQVFRMCFDFRGD